MRKRLLGALMLVTLVLAACGGEEAPDDQAAPTPSPEPVLCPLTGEEASTSVDVDRPALVVKIDNAPPARPQVGLDRADVVYEELGEGGLTRFLAVFHCQDASEVGPVRSARNVDVDVLKEYEPALFGYSGANNQVLAKIGDADWIVDLRHGSHGDAYTRAADRDGPYDLMSSTADLRGLEDAQGVAGPPTTGLVFDPDLRAELAAAQESPAAGSPDPAGSPAAPPPGVAVSFAFADRTPVRYEYDPASGTYLRFHGTEPHTLAGGAQVAAANVIIQKVEIVRGSVLDASGSPTMDSDVIGSGEAIVLRGGVAVTGTWNRPSLEARTTFTDAGGDTIELVPGSTFIHLVGQQRPVTVE